MLSLIARWGLVLLTIGIVSSGGLLLPLRLAEATASAQQGDRPTADSLLQQGIAAYQQNQLSVALEFWQQALTLYRQVQDRSGEANTLGAMGAVYLAQGNYQQAIQASQAFLQIAIELNNLYSQSQAQTNLAIAYKALGHYTLALERSQQSLKLMRQLQNRQGEGQVLLTLGNIYEALGDYERAKAQYEQSLVITRELQDLLGTAIALGNLGEIYASLAQYNLAIAAYQQSLSLSQTLGDAPGQASLLINLGSSYYAQGNSTRALQYYQRALKTAETAGALEQQSQALGSLGLVYADQRRYPQALEYQRRSLAIAQRLQNPREQARALNNLAHTLLDVEKFREAEQSLRQALQLLDSLRTNLSDTYKVSIFDTQTNTYTLLQQVLIAQNQHGAALETSEWGRARAFVDLVVSRLSAQSTTVAQVAATKLTTQPPDMQRIQQMARSRQATLVEYAIVIDDSFKFQAKQRGKDAQLYIWVVQPQGAIHFRRVDLQTALQPYNGQLKELVAASRQSLGLNTRSLTFQENPQLTRPLARYRMLYPELQLLHQLLIQPIADLLPAEPKTSVIVIPQDALFLVPFAALQDPKGQYLIEQHTLVSVPAIQILELTQVQRSRVRQRNFQQSLVVGNPTMPVLSLIPGEPARPLASLPGAEAEALEIARLLNTTALVGDRATKREVLQQMQRARVIHLATHGLLSDVRQSGIPGAVALAPTTDDDGLLTASEMLNLQLHPELVVLSACDTGGGQITGDGVIGLSRSLISAGAPSIIVSLWQVPDQPTAFLMTRFYQNWQRQPDKAQALRQAMLETLKDGNFPDPKAWAAFTLIGEAE